MVASAGLWPLLSPLAGQKRPPFLPGGRFLLSRVCSSLTGGGLRATARLSPEGENARASVLPTFTDARKIVALERFSCKNQPAALCNRAAVTTAEGNEFGAPVFMAGHGHCQSSSKAAISVKESSRRVDASLIRPEDHLS